MTTWTSEQKVIISKLYKVGRKIVKSKSHVDFLDVCLKSHVIPKCFKINKVIPGNFVEIQEKFKVISFECMQSEKIRFENDLVSAHTQFEHVRLSLQQKFEVQEAASLLNRVEKHMKKVHREESKKKEKKLKRFIWRYYCH